MKKGSKRIKHELEYDPSGTFKTCLICGEDNPTDDYCVPYKYYTEQIL